MLIVPEKYTYCFQGRLNGVEGFFPAEYVDMRNLVVSTFGR